MASPMNDVMTSSATSLLRTCWRDSSRGIAGKLWRGLRSYCEITASKFQRMSSRRGLEGGKRLRIVVSEGAGGGGCGKTTRPDVLWAGAPRHRASSGGKGCLKGGDPFVFGRGGEEALALAHAGIPFEIVPGVSAAIAVPAYAGIPVTHREYSSSVTIVTGHEDPTRTSSTVNWERLAKLESTLVILMWMSALAS